MKKFISGLLSGILATIIITVSLPDSIIVHKLQQINTFLYNDTNVVGHINAKDSLQLISAYGDKEAYHPKVISFKEKWNGYLYWMSFSPYPKGDQAKENPHILASNDMKNWKEPNGFHNPLDPQPPGDSKKQYSSDPHILYNEDLDRIEVFWRYVDEDKDISTIYRKYSKDGISWSEREVVLTGNKKDYDHVSPAIIYEDGLYKMWYVANGYKVWYIESSTGLVWTKPKEIRIPYDSPMKNWHLDVIHTDIGYEMVISAFKEGQNRNTMDLYYTRSIDNINYSTTKVILNPSKNKTSWDNKGIYRSSLLKINKKYYLFYSGIGQDGTRGVGLLILGNKL